jgi:hypothetical protein
VWHCHLEQQHCACGAATLLWESPVCGSACIYAKPWSPPPAPNICDEQCMHSSVPLSSSITLPQQLSMHANPTHIHAYAAALLSLFCTAHLVTCTAAPCCCLSCKQKEEAKDAAVLLNPAERVAAVRPMWEQRPHSSRVELLTVDLDTLRQQAKAQADKQRATAGAHSGRASSAGPRTAGWGGAGMQQCSWAQQRAGAALVTMLVTVAASCSGFSSSCSSSRGSSSTQQANTWQRTQSLVAVHARGQLLQQRYVQQVQRWWQLAVLNMVVPGL